MGCSRGPYSTGATGRSKRGKTVLVLAVVLKEILQAIYE
jgi:hypothetical protein